VGAVLAKLGVHRAQVAAAYAQQQAWNQRETFCATYADFWCRGMIITGTGAWRTIFEAAEPRKT
jgi:hypothetical protein